jgi:hypothetical protein
MAALPGPNARAASKGASKIGGFLDDSAKVERGVNKSSTKIEEWKAALKRAIGRGDSDKQQKEFLAVIELPKRRSLGAAGASSVIVKEIDVATGEWIEYGELRRVKITEIADIKNMDLLARYNKQYGDKDWVRVYGMADVEVLTEEGLRIEHVEVHWTAPRGKESHLYSGLEFKKIDR